MFRRFVYSNIKELLYKNFTSFKKHKATWVLIASFWKEAVLVLNGNEMYNVPIVSVLKTFLHHSGGQLRHGMDIAGMLCSNANSEYTSCIQSYTNIKKTSSSAYSKSGNSQWQLWIYFIFMVYVRPCPLDHMNCPHCKVHLSVFKTITLKFTESICCVDIV